MTYNFFTDLLLTRRTIGGVVYVNKGDHWQARKISVFSKVKALLTKTFLEIQIQSVIDGMVVCDLHHHFLGSFAPNSTRKKMLCVRIPSTILFIPQSTFCECDNLKRVFLSEGLREIHKYAFSGCRKLYEINIPTTVENIDHSVFKGCYSLSSLFVPGSTTIQAGAVDIHTTVNWDRQRDGGPLKYLFHGANFIFKDDLEKYCIDLCPKFSFVEMEGLTDIMT